MYTGLDKLLQSVKRMSVSAANLFGETKTTLSSELESELTMDTFLMSPDNLVSQNKFFDHCQHCPYDSTTMSSEKGGINTFKMFRINLHLLLNNPRHSRVAWVVTLLLICTVLVDTTFLIHQSGVKPVTEAQRNMYILVDQVVGTIYLTQLLLNLSSTKSIWRFFVDWHMWIDILAVTPFLVWLGGEDPTRVALLGVMRFIRVVKVIKLFQMQKANKNVEVLRMTLINSAPALIAFFVGVLMALIIIATLFFALEKGRDETTRRWRQEEE